MKATDTYQTINTKSEGFYKEKGSKFIAYAIPCSTENEAKIQINELRKKNPNACHVCYAWRFGTIINKCQDRFSDDGEPSNSAGKPIFGQIISFDLTNILIAVVRYYGGTNLGVGGLINAYKTASKEALSLSKITSHFNTNTFEIIYPYELMGAIMNLLKKNNVNQFQQGFEGDSGKITFEIRQTQSHTISKELDNLYELKYKQLN